MEKEQYSVSDPDVQYVMLSVKRIIKRSVSIYYKTLVSFGLTLSCARWGFRTF